MDNLLTVKDLEDFFKVSRTTITNWRKEGLPFVRIGRNVRFDPTEVRKWLEEQQNKEEVEN